MISHANLVTAVRQVSRGLRLTADDVVLALAPFSHVMGFVVTLGSALLAGARRGAPCRASTSTDFIDAARAPPGDRS